MNDVDNACSCPSGDGSLRHPCSAHPAPADVQPGGRVRLGDADPMRSALEDALQFVETLHSTVSGDSRKIVWRCLERGRAALSAQPSPGGQGVGMSADDFANMVEGEAGEYGEMLEDGGPYNGWMFSCEALIGFCGAIINGWGFELRAQQSALAARQPVGSIPEWFELVIRDVCELDPEDPDAADTVCIRLLDLRLIMERHALPAQAVDLAALKALYHAYVRLLESGRDRIIDLGGTCDPVDVMEANDVDLQAARRVLDSQAVGK